MDLYMAVIRFFHIFAGVFWVGSVWITTLFLTPAAEAIGSDADKFMTYISVRRHYPVIISVAAGINILAGLLLYWHDSIGLNLLWIRTPSGLAETFAALCAITGFIIAMAVIRPSFDELGRLGHAIHASGTPPTNEQMATLLAARKRLDRSELIVSILLALALLGMATMRYL